VSGHSDNNPEHNTTETVFVPHLGWFEMPRGDDVARYLREGWFEHDEQALWWLALREGDAVIDGGAHAGLYTRLGALAGARVVAAEPVGRTADLLEHNTRDLDCVHIERCALWSENTTVLVRDVPEQRAAYATVGADGEGTRTRARTIDAIVREERIDSLAILKLDLEGAEHEALLGARELLERRGVMIVMAELTPSILRERGSRALEAMAPLTGSGYEPVRLRPDTMALEGLDLGALVEHTNAFFVADRDFADKRLRGAGSGRRRIAREILDRGVATRAIKDASVERDHLSGLVDTLRADLRGAHERLDEMRERTDNEVRAARAEIGRVHEQWGAAHRGYDAALAELRDSLGDAQHRWSESRSVYESTIGELREQLERANGASERSIGTLRADLERVLERWSAAEQAHEKTASALKREIAATREGWDAARDAYERTITALREDLDKAHKQWARTREAYEQALLSRDAIDASRKSEANAGAEGAEESDGDRESENPAQTHHAPTPEPGDIP